MPTDGESSSSNAGSSSRTFLSPTSRATAHELRHNPQYMTADELAEHDGTRPDSMLLLALQSSTSGDIAILDVSAGSDYYAPGMPYHCFTGRDCSRAFSLTSLKPEHMHSNMKDASDAEWAVLDDWHKKLSAKYPMVGILLPACAEDEDDWRDVEEAHMSRAAGHVMAECSPPAVAVSS